MSVRPELLALLTALFLAAPAASAEEPPKAVAPASALPTAKTEGASFVVDEDAIVVVTGKTSVRLHPIAAAVFALSDGKRSVEAIRKGAEEISGYPIDEDTVYAVLDALADAKLLTARVTPPAGTLDPDLVIISDGTDPKMIVEKSAVTTGGAEWSKIKKSEEAAKAGFKKRNAAEANAKAQSKELKPAEEDRKKVHASLRVRKEEQVKAAQAMKADQMAALRKKSEEAAKVERKVRAKLRESAREEAAKAKVDPAVKSKG